MRENSIFAGLLSDAETVTLFAPEAMLADWLAFQRALIIAQGSDPAALTGFSPDIAGLAAATMKDGVPIPAWLTALKKHAPILAPLLHLNATSQDLTDTAMILAFKRANIIFDERLDVVAAALRALDGTPKLMARTRMQPALEITVGDRITRWLSALEDIGTRLAALRPGLEVLQYGGAVGLTPHDAVATAVAAELGLKPALHWHTTRNRLADYAGWLSLATGALGKIGLDLALMAQMGEVALTGGTSSAMPHKNNPVLAEVLQALARKNACDLSAVHLALLAEQERSGAAMTLEWLVLPEMVVTTGTALAHACALIKSISSLGG